MQNKIFALSLIGAAAAAMAPAYEAPSAPAYEAPSASASTTTYACNPAHQYPNGAQCISTAGSLTLVTPAPTFSLDVPETRTASTTGYACNPAHQYPNGAQCISTAGSLTLVTPMASSTGYACNPAHQYPGGSSCISTAESLTLVGPTYSLDVPESRTASTTMAPVASSTGYACNPAHSYPGGSSCISTAGSLTLVGPTYSLDTPEYRTSSAPAAAGTAVSPVYAAGNGTMAASGTGSVNTPAQYTGAAVANAVSGAVAGVAGIFAVLFL